MLYNRNNLKIFTMLFAVVGVALYSCESNRWFQSEDSLSAKIQTNWDKIRINPNSPIEHWNFSEGKVTRIRVTGQDSTIDHGNYSIHTTLSKAYLNISDFTTLVPLDNFNAKWEILELNGGVLFIATDHDGHSGVVQLEFEQK